MTKNWFTPTQSRYRAKFTLAVFLLTFGVILLGAYTRLTDAGLSCPDWPHCYGYLTAPHTEDQLIDANAKFPSTPVDTKKAWTEMTHRYLAGFLGFFIIAVSASLLFTYEAKNRSSLFIAIGLLFLLVTQVTLGMLTVTEKLKPIIVLSHLLTGISLLLLLWWAYLTISSQDNFFPARNEKKLKPWLWLGFIIVFCQIGLGGWVSTHYAGLACIDLPYCNQQLFPALHFNQFNTDLITIHMLHRIGALITAVYIGALALYLMTHQAFRALGAIMMATLCVQLTLGVMTIIWLRPVWLALCHHGVAILLLLTVTAALIKASIRWRDRYYAF